MKSNDSCNIIKICHGSVVGEEVVDHSLRSGALRLLFRLSILAHVTLHLGMGPYVNVELLCRSGSGWLGRKHLVKVNN